MISRINQAMRQGVGLVFLLVLVTLMVFSPISSNTMFPHLADLANHLVAIIQSATALKEGQFPLRILPYGLSELRYPFYQFYSPTSYLVAAWIYYAIGSLNAYVAYKLTLMFFMLLGGIYMYRLVLWFVPSVFIAMLTAAMYLTSPYLIIIINHVGAFNEALTISLMPVVVFYALRCFFSADLMAFLLSALSWYVMVTTHVITFLYGSLFVALFLLLLSLIYRQQARYLWVAGGAFLFGILMAMWYVIPPLLFAKYCWIQYTISNSILHVRPVSLLSLFSPGAQFLPIPDVTLGTNPSIGLPTVIACGVLLYALITRRIKREKQSTAFLYAVLATWFLIFFMMWLPWDFWKWLPAQMMVLQYRWRLLGQMMWCGALLFAWAVYWLFGSEFSLRHLMIGIVFVIVATRLWMPTGNLDYSSLDKLYAQPEFIYNENSYALEAARYLPYIDAVSVMSRETKQLRDMYYPGALKVYMQELLPPKVLRSTVMPRLTLQGTIAVPLGSQDVMEVYANGSFVSAYPMVSGTFEWALPLTQAIYATMKSQPVYITFKPKVHGLKQNHQNKIIIEKMVLDFTQSSHMISYEQVKSHCFMHRATRICKMQVPKEVNWIELPILYYPDMLKVTRNGKPVSYQSVMHDHYVNAAIVPLAGQENVIEMTFQGMPWANKVSQAMWAFFGLLLCYALVGKYRNFG